MILEVCAPSFESALAAQKAGANRIELCCELGMGGLTPSHGLLQKVVSELQIPVHVLIRPRSGNFTYSYFEWETMLNDIDFCRELGVAGIVCGTLNEFQELDVKRTQILVSKCRDMDFTFHRAFDWVKEPLETLDTLISLGATRILTSGQATIASEGLSLLKKLKDHAAERIEIMPGGGINHHNAKLFQEAGFGSIHFSATEKIQTLLTPPKISMQSQWEEGIVVHSSEDKIALIKRSLT